MSIYCRVNTFKYIPPYIFHLLPHTLVIFHLAVGDIFEKEREGFASINLEE